MDLEHLIKYLIAVAFFILAFAGVYFMLKKMGMI